MTITERLRHRTTALDGEAADAIDSLLAALKEMKAAVAEAVIFNGAGCDRRYIEAEAQAIAAIAKAES